MESLRYLAIGVTHNKGISIGDDIVVIMDKKKGNVRLLVRAPKHLEVRRIRGEASRDRVQRKGPAKTKDSP